MVRAGLIATLTLLLGSFGAGVAGAATFTVDDDKKECPAAGYRTIQAAIDAAGANDRVNVCRGTYREQVYIDHDTPGLVLENTPRRSAVLLAPPAFVIHEKLRAIVVAAARYAVVRGFRILGELPHYDCNRGFSHTVGVQIGDGDVLIEDNQISDIRDDCGFGGGIWSGDAQQELYPLELGGAGSTIRNNLIEQYREFGIIVENTVFAPPVTIIGNTLTGANSRPTTGVIVGQEGEADIVDNVISTNSTAGVSIRPAFAGGSSVRDNLIRGNGIGVRVVGPHEGGAVVSGNDVSANRGDGIVVGSPGDTITNNISHDNVGHGFNLGFGATASGNQALNNFGDGFHVDGPNTLTANTARGNRGLDCRDTSGPGGTGTLGTFSTWTNNRGRTSSPAGLCIP